MVRPEVVGVDNFLISKKIVSGQEARLDRGQIEVSP
jgi:hypothetical protein